MTLDQCMRDFKAKVEVCKVVRSGIGSFPSTTKLSYKRDNNALPIAINCNKQVKFKKIQQLGKDGYLNDGVFK